MSAFKLLDVTLAREDDRLGVRRTRQKPRVFSYSFYIDYAINLLILATVWSNAFSVAIELSNNRLDTRLGQRVSTIYAFYNFYNYFRHDWVESQIG